MKIVFLAQLDTCPSSCHYFARTCHRICRMSIILNLSPTWKMLRDDVIGHIALLARHSPSLNFVPTIHWYTWIVRFCNALWGDFKFAQVGVFSFLSMSKHILKFISRKCSTYALHLAYMSGSAIVWRFSVFFRSWHCHAFSFFLNNVFNKKRPWLVNYFCLHCSRYRHAKMTKAYFGEI